MDETLDVKLNLSSPTDEHMINLHEMSMSYWKSFGMRLGIQRGFADSPSRHLLSRPYNGSLDDVLASAWCELGLIDVDSGTH